MVRSQKNPSVTPARVPALALAPPVWHPYLCTPHTTERMNGWKCSDCTVSRAPYSALYIEIPRIFLLLLSTETRQSSERERDNSTLFSGQWLCSLLISLLSLSKTLGFFSLPSLFPLQFSKANGLSLPPLHLNNLPWPSHSQKSFLLECRKLAVAALSLIQSFFFSPFSGSLHFLIAETVAGAEAESVLGQVLIQVCYTQFLNFDFAK